MSAAKVASVTGSGSFNTERGFAAPDVVFVDIVSALFCRYADCDREMEHGLA
jgi:hypothetical protein